MASDQNKVPVVTFTGEWGWVQVYTGITMWRVCLSVPLSCLSVCVLQLFTRGYFLNCSAFCNQTWYCGASLWGEVLQNIYPNWCNCHLGENPGHCSCDIWVKIPVGVTVLKQSCDSVWSLSQVKQPLWLWVSDFGNSCLGFCAIRTGTESCQLFTLHVAPVFGATNTHNN